MMGNDETKNAPPTVRGFKKNKILASYSMQNRTINI